MHRWKLNLLFATAEPDVLDELLKESPDIVSRCVLRRFLQARERFAYCCRLEMKQEEGVREDGVSSQSSRSDVSPREAVSALYSTDTSRLFCSASTLSEKGFLSAINSVLSSSVQAGLLLMYFLDKLMTTR
jgi:hypothetical protein